MAKGVDEVERKDKVQIYCSALSLNLSEDLNAPPPPSCENGIHGDPEIIGPGLGDFDLRYSIILLGL